MQTGFKFLSGNFVVIFRERDVRAIKCWYFLGETVSVFVFFLYEQENRRLSASLLDTDDIRW